MNKKLVMIVIMMILLGVTGCSGSGNPVGIEKSGSSQDEAPLIGLVKSGGIFDAIGLLGAYELSINATDTSAELVPQRIGAIGESFIVSGIDFFTMSPCSTCLKVKSVSLTSDNDIVLTFGIQHPFQPGDPLKPPSGRNRLDLDIFDTALIIAPLDITPTNFPLTGSSAYGGICVNPDGYTTELEEMLSPNVSALPYYLVVDESEMTPIPNPTTYNKFAMGAAAQFNATFNLAGISDVNFNLYLTMGYGSSATRAKRLVPKYYNPEFNRKAAWKVVVTPPQGNDPPGTGNTWTGNDSTTPFNVKVEIYDWQIGAVVTSDPANYNQEPDTTKVYAASEVGSVTAEIVGATGGMTTSLASGIPDGTHSGMPGDPLVYLIPIANQNLLPEGEYTGLVKITDTRVPQSLPPMGERDYMIDSEGGTVLHNYAIPEFATYQTFTATVLGGNLPPVASAVISHQVIVGTDADITFDSSASSDPDGTITLYEWDFDGDGVYSEPVDDSYTGTSSNPTHTFHFGDVINIQLRVTDNRNATDTLDTPLLVTPFKNLVLRSGTNISDIATIKSTNEVLVMFDDHQVWKYDDSLNNGTLLYTMPGSNTIGRRIEASNNGDSCCGWWDENGYMWYSYWYDGTLVQIHDLVFPDPPHNFDLCVTNSSLWVPPQTHNLIGMFDESLVGGRAWFRSGHAPTTYYNFYGNYNMDIGPGPNRIDIYYLKGVHALDNPAATYNIFYLEGAPEWRVEKSYILIGFTTGWGGTQTDADTGFYDPQDITSDEMDNIFVLDILSTGVRKIKKFFPDGTTQGSFGNNTTMASDPKRLDGSFITNFLYISMDDKVSVFAPTEQ